MWRIKNICFSFNINTMLLPLNSLFLKCLICRKISTIWCRGLSKFSQAGLFSTPIILYYTGPVAEKPYYLGSDQQLPVCHTSECVKSQYMCDHVLQCHWLQVLDVITWCDMIHFSRMNGKLQRKWCSSKKSLGRNWGSWKSTMILSLLNRTLMI